MVKKTLKKIFELFGFSLNKINIANSIAYQTVKALNVHGVNVIFDVGANTGQFANELRSLGYKGKIISFEPLPAAHKVLTENANKDSNWIVHTQCAVGASLGEIKINVAGNSVSSSILPMRNSHLEAAPESKYTHQETVPLITIDSIYNQYCNKDDNLLLKVDTQGYEWLVLDGAAETLISCKGVSLELSLVTLYEGQKLWSDCESRLKKLGLLLYAIQPCFVDSNTGQTLQVDGLFFKSKF